MQKCLIVIYIIDIAVIVMLSAILVWWKATHTQPGLSEMLNIKLFVLYLVIALIMFIVLTVMFTRKKHKH